MKIFNHNTHPIFEADQVLTSHHLNDMFNYLEEQERMTRAKLIGSGIVCGLEISLVTSDDSTSIHISRGVGITSQGHLIAMEKEANNIFAESFSDKNVYSYFKEYVDPINLDDTIQSNDTTYPFFMKEGAQIKLYELHDKNEAGFELLSNFKTTDGKGLKDFGVLLYLECYDKELKNCIENDCNEKGVERTFTLRKLLVSKDDLRDIICKEEAALTAPKSYDEIDNYVNARYYLKPINLPRILLSSMNVEEESTFFEDYQNYETNATNRIANEFADSASFLAPILNKNLSNSRRYNFFNSIGSVFAAYRLELKICNIQYFYDFICDIVETYNELAEEFFEMMSQCCPPLGRYPKHIRLGDLDPENRCIPTPYRTTFTQSPIHNHGHQQKEKVHHLIRKLEAVINQFRLPSGREDIRITPSAALSQPLSKRAIPYYYEINKDFVRDWNYDFSRKCRISHNLSYHSDRYEEMGIGVTPDYILNPLKYGLNKYDFFRIEGHVCKKYSEALQRIQTIRDKNNLPFDVIALKLSRDAKGTTFDKATCNFKDLNILCEAWKSELQCLLGKVINKLSSTNYSQVIVNPNAAVAATAASTSSGGLSTASYTTATALYLKKEQNDDREILEAANAGFTGTAQFIAAETTQKRSYGHVREQLAVEEQTIGNTLRKVMAVESDICKFDTIGTELIHAELVDLPGYDYLNNQDYTVAFLHPLNLSVAMLEFSKAMDKDCHEMDLEDLEKKLGEMNRRAAAYMNDLLNYRKLPNRPVNIDFETMIQITSVLNTNCSFATLKEIRAEMERRKTEILKKNLFSEYLKKNPGIDHKSGVPKGGTFIMVYTDIEQNKVIIAPDRQGNNTDSYIVKGLIKSFENEVLIGAVVKVKGTALGTVSDIDGRFQLQVPIGKQILVFSYSGYQSEEVDIDEASSMIVTLGQDPDLDNSGVVIADFYVPYLCCSDCLPVTYVFPEGEEILPEESIDLDISKKRFCTPTEDDAHVFIVSPDDGTVTGEGVVTTDANKYAFDPNEVNLGNNIFKIVTPFEVNGTEIPLSIRVEKMPSVKFVSEVEWRPSEQLGRGSLPYIDLTIEEYDERFEYMWVVYVVFEEGNEFLFERPHVGNLDNPSMQTFSLEQYAEPQTELLIELVAKNGSCKNTGSGKDKIPPNDIKELIVFKLSVNGDPIGQQENNYYEFSNESDIKVTINVTPLGEFVAGGAINSLDVRGAFSEDENTKSYVFNPYRRPDGEYELKYNSDTDSAILTIKINGTPFIRNFTNLPALRDLGKDSKLVETLGTDGPGYQNTVKLAHVLIEKLRHPAISQTISKGEYNDEFVTKLAPAMNEVASKVIAANNPAARNNNAKQSTMLGLYEKQVTLLLDMVAAQSQDIKIESKLSKMFTQVDEQLKAMKKAGIKINVRKRLENTITEIYKTLRGKPNAQRRFIDLNKTVIQINLADFKK